MRRKGGQAHLDYRLDSPKEVENAQEQSSSIGWHHLAVNFIALRGSLDPGVGAGIRHGIVPNMPCTVGTSN